MLGDQLFEGGKPRSQQVRERRLRQRVDIEPVPPKPVRRKNRKRGRPRRRYDVALPVALGAEARLPAVPRIRWGSRAVSFLAILILAAMIRGAMMNPQYRVEAAAVEGSKLLGEAQIRSIAGVSDRPIFLVDPQAVEGRLEGYPEIKDASVAVGWPNLVMIQVEERNPVIAWQDGLRTWWLSPSGTAFIERDPWPGLIQVKSSVPVLDIQEDPSHPVIDREIVLSAMTLSQELPEISEYSFDPVHGLGFQDPRGWTVYFGKDGDIPLKVSIYRAIETNLSERGIQVGVISVEDPYVPYYRVTR